MKKILIMLALLALAAPSWAIKDLDYNTNGTDSTFDRAIITRCTTLVTVAETLIVTYIRGKNGNIIVIDTLTLRTVVRADSHFVGVTKIDTLRATVSRLAPFIYSVYGGEFLINPRPSLANRIAFAMTDTGTSSSMLVNVFDDSTYDEGWFRFQVPDSFINTAAAVQFRITGYPDSTGDSTIYFDIPYNVRKADTLWNVATVDTFKFSSTATTVGGVDSICTWTRTATMAALKWSAGNWITGRVERRPKGATGTLPGNFMLWNFQCIIQRQ